MLTFRARTGRWTRYMLVIPSLIVLFAVVVYPLVFSLLVSFQGASLANFRTAPWIGLGNYTRLFHDRLFWNSLLFTVKFVPAAVFLELLLGTALALFFFLSSFPGKGILFTVMLTPMMIAPIYYAISLKLAFNSLYGVVPWFLNKIGLQLDFFNTPSSAFWTLVGIDVWQWTSFSLLIIYTGLLSVPDEILEAAMVDGANRWWMIWKILLPQALPAIGVASLLRMIDAFKVFDTIYVLTGGGPGVSTRSTSVQIWYYTFGEFNIGRAAAYTIVLLIIVSVVAQVFIKKVFKEEELD